MNPQQRRSMLVAVFLFQTVWFVRECAAFGFVDGRSRRASRLCSSSLPFLIRKDTAHLFSATKHEHDKDHDNDNSIHPSLVEASIAPHPTEIPQLPLFRAPWTELPGYQTVLTIDPEEEPHYHDMFSQILLQQESTTHSLIYGHVYLYQGSTNLGNPAYNLPERLPNGTITTVDPEWCPLIGTLMKIVDYQFLSTTTDASSKKALRLVVQGIGRFHINYATAADNHPQVPYAMAAHVTRLMDDECWKPLCGIPMKAQIAKEGQSTTTSDSSSLLERAMMHAATAAAMTQEDALEQLEFRPVTLPSTGESSNPNLLQDDQNPSPSVQQVSPLSNFNLDSHMDFWQLRQDMERVYAEHLQYQGDTLGSDEILMAATMFPMGTTASTISDNDSENVLLWEAKVWTQLQELLRRLAHTGARVPIPSQLLGLLPPSLLEHQKSNDGQDQHLDWSDLERQAQYLKNQQSSIGTFTKSPFVRVSNAVPEYPAVRRASRFSFAVWTILATVSFDNQGASREELLQMRSAQERLYEAHRQLVRLNQALKTMAA